MTQTLRALARVGALLGALALPQAALAQSNTTLGVGSGAVAGALVAGPIGAVAGAVVGGLVGSSTEGRRRHVRRVRRARHYAAPIRRERRAEAARPRAAAARPREATAWTDPH